MVFEQKVGKGVRPALSTDRQVMARIFEPNISKPKIVRNRPSEHLAMRKVFSNIGPYGPCDIYVVGATLLAHVHTLGWMLYGSAPPPPKGHPFRQINEQGEPLWVTGTFLPQEADNWLSICRGKGYLYHDKSVLSGIHQKSMTDKPN